MFFYFKQMIIHCLKGIILKKLIEVSFIDRFLFEEIDFRKVE